MLCLYEIKLIIMVMSIDLIDENSEKVDQPSHIKIPLKTHQLCVIKRAIDMENGSVISFPVNSELKTIKRKTITKVCYLGDKVGSGKTLCILGIIANNLSANKKDTVDDKEYYVSQYTKSIRYIDFTTIQPDDTIMYPNLNVIVVPIILFKQWEDNIRNFIDMKFISISSKKQVKTIKSQDFTDVNIFLISSRVYNDFTVLLNKCCISRLFFDEALTINIPNSQGMSANMMYLVDASFNIRRPEAVNRGFLARILAFFSESCVICCTEEFISKSFSLPEPSIETIICEEMKTLSILRDILPNGMVSSINSDTIGDLYRQYRICTFKEADIIKHIFTSQIADKSNLMIDLEAEQKKTYINPSDKNDKIKQITKKIEDIDTKITEMELCIGNDTCMICYDIPVNKCLTNCCKKVTCFECIGSWLIDKHTCPYCRRNISLDKLSAITEQEFKVTELKNKLYHLEILLKSIENTDKKLLIFSQKTSTFNKIYDILDNLNIQHRTITKSNNLYSQSYIDKYKYGNIQCLLMNSSYVCAGLNLQMTTDLILYHKYSKSIENQIIGRCIRPGLTHVVNIFHLRYEKE